MSLGDASWLHVERRAAAIVLVLPLGSTEQHGPHLPLSTDTDIAVALAWRLAAARPDVLVAPAMAYGSSGEHDGFAGTVSIGQAALETVLVEIGRSTDAFRALVLVSTHGGNAEPVRRAVDLLAHEGRRVMAWSPSQYRDAHAGRSETSILLALDPRRVRMDLAEAGATQPLDELMATMRTGGVKAVSANGVLGDPIGATDEEGAALLDAMAADLFARVGAFVD